MIIRSKRRGWIFVISCASESKRNKIFDDLLVVAEAAIAAGCSRIEVQMTVPGGKITYPFDALLTLKAKFAAASTAANNWN